jgi:hypothetical protein
MATVEHAPRLVAIYHGRGAASAAAGRELVCEEASRPRPCSKTDGRQQGIRSDSCPHAGEYATTDV